MENKFNNITEKTTLGELLAILHPGEKPGKTPTPKELRETAGDPAASEERCLVYRNGWAVYDNGSGCTVLWLPECVSFTWQFEKPKTNEDWIGSSQEELPEGLLASQPWPIAVTLVGDHRVEENMLNRTGSRHGTKAYEDIGFDADEEKDFMKDSEIERFFSQQERYGENPETTYIRKEMVHEIMASLTQKQREVVILYYLYEYTQEKIGEILSISRDSVNDRLEGAEEKIKKFL